MKLEKKFILIIFLMIFRLESQQEADCPSGQVPDCRYPSDKNKCDIKENLQKQLCVKLPSEANERSKWIKDRYDELYNAFAALFKPPTGQKESITTSIENLMSQFKKEDLPKNYAFNVSTYAYEPIDPKNPNPYQFPLSTTFSNIFPKNQVNCLYFTPDTLPDAITNKDFMYRTIFQESCRDDAILLREKYQIIYSLQEALINIIAQKLPEIFSSPIIQQKGIYRKRKLDDKKNPIINDEGKFEYVESTSQEAITPSPSTIELGPSDKPIKWQLIQNFDLINPNQLLAYLMYLECLGNYCNVGGYQPEGSKTIIGLDPTAFWALVSEVTTIGIFFLYPELKERLKNRSAAAKEADVAKWPRLEAKVAAEAVKATEVAEFFQTFGKITGLGIQDIAVLNTAFDLAKLKNIEGIGKILGDIKGSQRADLFKIVEDEKGIKNFTKILEDSGYEVTRAAEINAKLIDALKVVK